MNRKTGIVVLLLLPVVVFTVWKKVRTPVAEPLQEPSYAAFPESRQNRPFSPEDSPIPTVNAPSQDESTPPELEKIIAITDEDERAEAMEYFVSSVEESELSMYVKRLASATHPHAIDLRNEFVRRWAVLDPVAASDWASSLPAGPGKTETLKHVAIIRAGADLATTLEWARGLPEGEGRQAVQLTLAYEAARTDPLEAMLIALALPPGRTSDQLLVHAAGQWVGAGDYAVEWAVEMPDVALRDQVLAAIGTALSEYDPVAAATLVVEQISPGVEQNRAVVAVVQRWVQVAPTDAAAWVEQFADVPVRDFALKNLVGIWVAQDLEAPAKWLQGLPPGSFKDAGVAVFAETIAPRSIDTARVWAATITDPAKRSLCEAAIDRLIQTK